MSKNNVNKNGSGVILGVDFTDAGSLDYLTKDEERKLRSFGLVVDDLNVGVDRFVETNHIGERLTRAFCPGSVLEDRHSFALIHFVKYQLEIRDVPIDHFHMGYWWPYELCPLTVSYIKKGVHLTRKKLREHYQLLFSNLIQRDPKQAKKLDRVMNALMQQLSQGAETFHWGSGHIKSFPNSTERDFKLQALLSVSDVWYGGYVKLGTSNMTQILTAQLKAIPIDYGQKEALERALGKAIQYSGSLAPLSSNPKVVPEYFKYYPII